MNTRAEGLLDAVLAELLATGLEDGERIEVHHEDCPVSNDGDGCRCSPMVIRGPLGNA